ncbi:MAG: zf-TFIIB domain-containing protein [Gammaproteobacteria bacterium]
MDTNCKNCGATLSFEFLDNRLKCGYCDTIHVPCLREELGIDLASNVQSEDQCPLCSEPLSHGKINEWHLLVCSECRGLLVSRQDLLNIIVYSREQSVVTDRKPDAIDASALTRVLDCPSCETPMKAHPYFGPGDFVIDSCVSCDRIWLDGGELDRSSTIRWGGSAWR